MTALEYFKGDELAANVWQSKYAAEGEQNPDDMHRRLAKEFARIEAKYPDTGFYPKDSLSEYGKYRQPLDEESIYQLFKDFKYVVPQGRVLAGLGVTNSYRSLSNCIVLPSPKDSYSSILYVDTMLVSAAKRGCGYGLDISKLRPFQSNVKNAANTSTGAVSFMERFSNSTREVAQNSRRGACLLSIDVRHPDVEQFAIVKHDLTKVTGANISIKLRDDFMQAVKEDTDYILRWPCETPVLEGFEPDEYNVLKQIPLENIYVKKVRAKELWNTIINSAHSMAEPGLFFWDKMKHYDPVDVYPEHEIECTNACSEEPMSPYDTCRLICCNLFNFVINPFIETSYIDFDLLYKTFYEQMILSDNLVDLEIEYIQRIIDKINSDPEPIEEKIIELTLWKKIKEKAEKGRRTGSGITGLGDMFAALGVKYDSQQALQITGEVMKKKMEAELDASIDLSVKRGSFPDHISEVEYSFDNSLSIIKGKTPFYQDLYNIFPEQVKRMIKHGRRNINWSTIAPTGSMSLLTQTTSGCEPLFSPFHFRRRKINPSDKNVRVDFVDQNGDKWMEYPVIHPKFKEYLYAQHHSLSIPRIGIQGSEMIDPSLWEKEILEQAFKHSPWYQSTANDIDWIKRVEIQSVLQKYTTAAISSTINLPNNVTQEEVSEIYMKAWEKGLKGITVYRDGCRTGVLVNKTDKKEFEQKDAPKRPKDLPCTVDHVKVKGQPFTVVVGLLEEKPYEVFATPYEVMKDYSSGILTKKSKGIYNLTCSLDNVINLTSGMSEEHEAITRLVSTSLRHGANVKFICEQLLKVEGELNSFTKAIARILKKHIPDGELSTLSCNECGSTQLVFQEGCLKCNSCGMSRCG